MLTKLITNYGVCGALVLIKDSVKTKLFYPSARIIRSGFRVRGRKYIDFGNKLTTGVSCRIDAFPSGGEQCLSFGNDIQINDYVHIAASESISIGDRVLIASHVFISDHNHGIYDQSEASSSPLIPPEQRALSGAAIVIGEDVWIGEYVAVLPGVTIGKGTIIGTMSVVTKNIPDYSIAVGSPARVIKQYNFEQKKWIKV